MAKLTRNAVISGLSGSLGKDHYARHRRDGKTIISLKPDFSNRQFSEGRLDVQGGMKAAAAYAKVTSKNNPIYARLAKGTARNVYNVAVGDWFNPPVIHSMDLWNSGLIRVSATDDVQVTKVVITVLDQEGKSLEQDEAELVLGVCWDYRATNRGRIQVEAWDLAGNVTRREFDDPSQRKPPEPVRIVNSTRASHAVYLEVRYLIKSLRPTSITHPPSDDETAGDNCSAYLVHPINCKYIVNLT